MHYVSLGKTESGQDIVGCGHRHPLVYWIEGGDGTRPLVITGCCVNPGLFVFEVSKQTVAIYCGQACWKAHKRSVESLLRRAALEGEKPSA